MNVPQAIKAARDFADRSIGLQAHKCHKGISEKRQHTDAKLARLLDKFDFRVECNILCLKNIGPLPETPVCEVRSIEHACELLLSALKHRPEFAREFNSIIGVKKKRKPLKKAKVKCTMTTPSTK